MNQKLFFCMENNKNLHLAHENFGKKRSNDEPKLLDYTISKL